MPVFWFGLILILFLSVQLKLLPPGGHYSLEQDAGILTVLRYSIMPVIVLSLFKHGELDALHAFRDAGGYP